MALKDQTEFETLFNSFYDQKLRARLDANREQYRMVLKDADEREERGLSAIPGTRSTSAVDRAVEKALVEYHADPNAISYGAVEGELDPRLDLQARTLTKLFHHRAEHTFPFFTWHSASLTAAFADGLEAAFVWWRKESYTEKRKAIVIAGPDGEDIELSGPEAELVKQFTPDLVKEVEIPEEITTKDSWWIDQLKPGEEILWDVGASLLDANLGERLLLKVRRSLGEVRQLQKNGIFDLAEKLKDDDFKKYMTVKLESDKSATVNDPETTELGDLNRMEVWVFFFKEDGRWMVEFSIEGEKALSKAHPVNDVFFNGRRVDRLPVVIGTHKMKLWENFGRGEPEVLEPLEKEQTNLRNLVNDAVKQQVVGRYRVDPWTDLDLDDLLNSPIVHAEKGEFDKFDQNLNVVDAMRMFDVIGGDMNQLTPIGMDNKSIVPRGTGKTLGAVEMAMGENNEKLGVGLVTRNQTFFIPLLNLIAELEFAFESDETVMRIAAKKAGAQPPQTVNGQGQPIIDFRKFDFRAKGQTSAGLGTQSRQTKLQNILAIHEFRMKNGLPTDAAKIASVLEVLSGFDPGQFDGQPGPKPEPEITANLNLDWETLATPELLSPVQQQLVQKILGPSGKVQANVQGRIENKVPSDVPQMPGGEGPAVMPEGGMPPGDMGGPPGPPTMDQGGIEMGGQGGID